MSKNFLKLSASSTRFDVSPSGHLLRWHKVAAISHPLPVVLKHHRLHNVREGRHDLNITRSSYGQIAWAKKKTHRWKNSPPAVGWKLDHPNWQIPCLLKTVLWPFRSKLHQWFFLDAAWLTYQFEKSHSWKFLSTNGSPFSAKLAIYLCSAPSLVDSRQERCVFCFKWLFLGGVYANRCTFVQIHSSLFHSILFICFCFSCFCSLIFDCGLFLSTSF